MKARAQVSAEYLGITGFFLVATLVFFVYAFSTFGENKNLALSQDAAIKIASNANLVASLGEGSKIFFDVELPDNSQSIELSEKFVKVNYSSSAGAVYAYSYAKANFTPTTISVSQGRGTLSAAFIDGNVVVQ